MDLNPDRHAGRALMIRHAVFWTVAILVATLFPYDPVLVMTDGLARFDTALFGNPVDFSANILLFLPWGFCVAGVLGKRLAGGHVIWITLLSGVLLSGMVEFFQLGLPSRNPALADVMANLLGVAAGIALGVFRGERLWTRLGSLSGYVTRALNSRVLLGLLAVHLLLAVGLLRFADHRSGFGNWDPDCHLNLGNESTGNRPWRGSLGRARLWGAVLSGSDVERLLAGDVAVDDTGQEVLWSFDPARFAVEGDVGGQAAALVWRPAPPAETGSETVRLSEHHWLTSSVPAVELTEALRKSGCFTLSVTVRTADTSQTGPGRIVSLSRDPLRRNFTLGQEGADLVFRLRTPVTGLNGSDPALVVPGVFAAAQSRHLVVTYDGRVLTVYPGADTPPSLLELRYAGVFTGLGCGFNVADQVGYKAVFRWLLWLPGVLILTRLLWLVRLSRFKRLV